MRIADVSLGTIRNILTIQGRAWISAAIGFVEVTIFVLAISRVIASINESPWYVLGYSSGFAAGTLLGIKLESLIGLGTRLIRTITVRENNELVASLRGAGFGVTVVGGEGMNGPVYVLFSVVQRRNVDLYVELIKKYAPKAFYTVEGLRFSHGGFWGPTRKGK